MEIKSFNVKNVGIFKDLNVPVAPTETVDSNVTVFVGNNGSGKTSLLKSLATSLSWFISRLRSEKGNGSPIPEEAIMASARSAAITLVVSDHNSNIQQPANTYSWTIARTGRGKKGSFVSELNDSSKLADNYRIALTNSETASLPLIAFYPVERLVIDVPLRIRKRHSFSQIAGYDNSLTQGVDFRRFFEWFRQREDLENEIAREKTEQFLLENSDRILEIEKNISNAERRVNAIKEFDFEAMTSEIKKLKTAFQFISDATAPNYSDNQLNAVRNAIHNFMDGFSNISVRREPNLHMAIEKNGVSLNVMQLSQGEKSLMALVGDIARRLSMMNPAMDDPLTGDGIVLIDEIDLHLHPSWQRDIIARLTKTFPNCQFILTTHSPLVISDCKNILVYSIDDGAVVEVPSQYGQDANSVLLDVMNTHIRNAHIALKLSQLLDLIQDKKIPEASKLLSELEVELPVKNIELIKARLLLRKQELRIENDNKRG